MSIQIAFKIGVRSTPERIKVSVVWGVMQTSRCLISCMQNTHHRHIV